MNAASYLILVNIYLILFYAFYALVIQNETFFKWNRVFLLGSGMLSFLLPIIQSDWVKTMFVTEDLANVTKVITFNEMTVQSLAAESEPQIHWIWWIYLLGVLFFSFRFIWQLIKVSKSFGKGVQAQSFFNKVYVSEELPSREAIIKHEQTHSTQLHSADVLFFELLGIINWFNPMVYAYKKAIKYIHEFIADESASGSDKSEYALLLVSNSFGIQKEQLTNNFFNQSLLKRRIVMLNKSKSRKTAVLKYGLCAPLFGVMVILSSATIEQSKVVKQVVSAIQLPASDLSYVDIMPKAFRYERPVEKKNENSAVIPKLQSVTLGTESNKATSSQNDKLKFKKLGRLMGVVWEVLKYSNMEDNVGNAVYSITISENKKISNVELVEGVGSEWEEKIVTKVKNYGDTIDIAPGKYSFLAYNTITNIVGNGAKKTPRNPVLNSEKYLFVVGQNKDVTSDENIDTLLKFHETDVKPEYPGGMSEFHKWIGQNFKYPKEAIEKGISGRAVIQFVVEKDGKLVEIKSLRDPGYGIGEAAIKLLSSSKPWSPALKDGKPVKVKFVLPLQFAAPSKTGNVSDNKFNVRSGGTYSSIPPMFLLNGKEITEAQAGQIKPDAIKSMTVYKDKADIEKYGEKGKHGVVIITLK